MILVNYQAYTVLQDTYMFQNVIKADLVRIVEKMGLSASDFTDGELIELAKDWKL